MAKKKSLSRRPLAEQSLPSEGSSQILVELRAILRTFTNVFTGKSSGTKLSLENYDFPDVTSRYLRITVNGNTQNNWASITEITVNGFAGTTPPPPPPPLPPAPCTVDKFGIKEIYCTKTGGGEE
jgi:hypothetical protein